MKITHISLKNFRSFEHFDLELTSPVTLILGKNAEGKSAVLDALAIAVGEWLRGTANANHEGRRFLKSDPRLVRQESVGLPTANPSYPIAVATKGIIGENPVEWQIELRKPGGHTTRARNIRTLAACSEQQATDNPTSALPVLAYYGTARLWVQKSKKSKDSLWSRMDGYAACLDIASNTQLLTTWMRDQRLRFLEAREEGKSDTGQPLPHLVAVESAAVVAIEGAKRFFYSLKSKELQVEFEDGRLIGFDQLSDGQCTLLLLFADLAWRTAQLNPHFGESAPAKTEGVVLIDEIELHLYPAWQRTVIGNLTSVFPKIQFIITTHSPQVIATAAPEWIRVLEAGVVRRVQHSQGRDSNSILADVMGVAKRPSAMEDQLGQLDSMIERGELSQARTRLNELRKVLGPDHELDGLEWELCDEEADAEN